MFTRIFVRHSDQPPEMLEHRPFDTEDELQSLIFDHPETLPGNCVLLTREKGVPESSGSGANWWVDLLFIDDDGIPTLIEVKKASNSETRRSVVGQMLDYASGNWELGDIRSTFERESPDAVLPDGFWDSVGRNIALQRFKLLFVSDEIPVRLERIVLLLDDQMRDIAVGAIEIKRYVRGTFETFVTRAIGAASSDDVRHPSLPIPNRIDFMAMLEDDEQRDAVSQIFDAVSGDGKVDYHKESITIRSERPPPASPISLVWLHHPGSSSYDIRFGYENRCLTDVDAKGALETWEAGIAEIDDAEMVTTWPKSTTWSIPYALLPANIDAIVELLKTVMSELRGGR